jgi:hypothetical protein
MGNEQARDQYMIAARLLELDGEIRLHENEGMLHFCDASTLYLGYLA